MDVLCTVKFHSEITFFNRNFLSKTSLTFYSVAKLSLAWNMVGVLWMCSMFCGYAQEVLGASFSSLWSTVQISTKT